MCNYVLSYIFFFFKYIMLLINIIVPILLIISLVIKFIKIIKNPDDVKLKNQIFNSIFALFLVFFIPLMINIIINWCGNNYNLNCALSTNNSLSNYEETKNTKKGKILNDNDDYEKGNKKTSSSSTGVIVQCGTKASEVEYAIEPLKEGLPVPHYLQYDSRWGDEKIYDVDTGTYATMSGSGCDITCFAMVASYLLNKQIYPTDVYKNIDSGNAAWSGNFSIISKKYGINEPTFTQDFNDVITALKNGQVVIGHYGKSVFTSEGHFIVIRGIASDGLFLVNDPTEGQYEKNVQINKHYTLNEMTTSTSNWMGWFIFDKKKC